MKILFVGAHFDDVELGCGGTVARYVAEGHEVHIYVATDSGYSNYAKLVIRKPEIAFQEGQSAAKVLGVTSMTCGDFPTNNLMLNDDLVCSILELIDYNGYDMVFTHWTGDVHLDHTAVARATIAAARHVPRLLMYRSNHYDSGVSFRGTFYVDVGNYMETKREAIRAHQSEYNRAGEKWMRFIENQNQMDGQKIGVEYAECFEIIKYLV